MLSILNMLKTDLNWNAPRTIKWKTYKEKPKRFKLAGVWKRTNGENRTTVYEVYLK